MKKFAILCATALSLTMPGIAQAASPDGDHTFVGTVEVRKNLPTWTSCTLTAVVRVTGGVARLQSASLAGMAPCGGITFSGLPSAPVTLSLPTVTVPSIGITIPPILVFPTDACLGPLPHLWGGNTAAPRTITFVDGFSDVPDGNPDNPGASELPCRIRGVISQTSTPALNL